MKSLRVTAQAGGLLKIEPLPLPSVQRTGNASADTYRNAAQSGAAPKSFSSLTTDFLRTIVLSDGKFKGLATQAGQLLTVITSGSVTVIAGSETAELQNGDLLLTDDKTSSAVVLDARDSVRLVQIGVSPDFPGAEAKIQPTGTYTARPTSQQVVTRIYKDPNNESAHFANFFNFFPAKRDSWSTPFPATGFRMLYWDGGEMDYHPCVIKQLAILLSGKQQMEVRGGGGGRVSLLPGDICLAEDTTGEGHLNRVWDGFNTISVVLADSNHWPIEP